MLAWKHHRQELLSYNLLEESDAFPPGQFASSKRHFIPSILWLPFPLLRKQCPYLTLAGIPTSALGFESEPIAKATICSIINSVMLEKCNVEAATECAFAKEVPFKVAGKVHQVNSYPCTICNKTAFGSPCHCTLKLVQTWICAEHPRLHAQVYSFTLTSTREAVPLIFGLLPCEDFGTPPSRCMTPLGSSCPAYQSCASYSPLWRPTDWNSTRQVMKIHPHTALCHKKSGTRHS